jgi:hypothetical protein
VPKVRIVADYCSKGYQLLGEEARAGGDLPVSEALAVRLLAWNDRYEADCHPADYEDVTGMRFDFVAFAREGLEIAKAVKRELPQWTVIYWDEGLDWYLARDPRTYDPARAEYEITLKQALAPPTEPLTPGP